MSVELDEKMRKHLRDLEFVESATTDGETQSALLESLNEDKDPNKWVGTFNSVEEMSDYFISEMEKEGYKYVKEKDSFEKTS